MIACTRGVKPQRVSGRVNHDPHGFVTRERHMEEQRGGEAVMDEGIDTCKDG